MILPVVLPSYATAANITGNPIGLATATMFVLSFPSSLFGIPLLLGANYFLSIDPNSIQGMYLDLLMLFALGFVQWFLIVPRIWRSESEVPTIYQRTGQSPTPLPVSRMAADFEFSYSEDQTPLEKVLNADDSK
jgi:hypothetical protein